MKYIEIEKIFQSMNKEPSSNSSTVKPVDVVKSERSNADINRSDTNFAVNLSPNPEADGVDHGLRVMPRDDAQPAKTFTFDVRKATSILTKYENVKNCSVDSDTLPHVLEWANSDDNAFGITLSELKQALSQRNAASQRKKERKKKRKAKHKAKDSGHESDAKDEEETEIETECVQSMVDFCGDSAVKELLREYEAQLAHPPTDGKQLLSFVEEQRLRDKDARFKELKFEVISKAFAEYAAYKESVEARNEKEKDKPGAFECGKVLETYVKEHGEPKDVQVFYRYALGKGYRVEFKALETAFNEVKGIKKKKAKKVKVKMTSKRLKSLYKKSNK